VFKRRLQISAEGVHSESAFLALVRSSLCSWSISAARNSFNHCGFSVVTVEEAAEEMQIVMKKLLVILLAIIGIFMMVVLPTLQQILVLIQIIFLLKIGIQILILK
jgi:hypothetical protein